jgi:hydrogenase maturation protein HypF
MELESAAQAKGFPIPFEISQRHGLIELDWRPALVWLVKNKSQPLPWLAASFHRGLAEALVRWVEEGAAAEGLKTVALSGGVWQNRRLLLTTAALLQKKGFTLLGHRRYSPNDESISLGQAAFGLALWGKG